MDRTGRQIRYRRTGMVCRLPGDVGGIELAPFPAAGRRSWTNDTNDVLFARLYPSLRRLQVEGNSQTTTMDRYDLYPWRILLPCTFRAAQALSFPRGRGEAGCRMYRILPALCAATGHYAHPRKPL